MPIIDEMEKVEEGHLVRWNNRTKPHIVTDVSSIAFTVTSHSNSKFVFYQNGPYLVNQQSGNEYAVDQFEIVGEAYDIESWLDSR